MPDINRDCKLLNWNFIDARIAYLFFSFAEKQFEIIWQ